MDENDPTYKELPADSKRQAVPSTEGTIYQAWASIDAWLKLRTVDEIIYLEGAEDFDVVRSGSATAVQVKKHKSSISLGTQVARVALENFWTLATTEQTRRVEMHFLTTSTVSKEKGLRLNGMKGIHAWRVARTNVEYAQCIIEYLCRSLSETSPLSKFIQTASVPELQERLFNRFHWFTEQPDLETLKRSILDRIVTRLHEMNKPVSLANNVSLYLESRYWEIVIQRPSTKRCLTLGDLLLQIDKAITIHLPIPIHLVPDLLENQSFGSNLLELLLDKPMKPPEPLLDRPELVKRIWNLVEQRRAVMLTGTVHMGKTTTAQQVAEKACPSAWWLKLTGRTASQVDTLLLALAIRVDNPDCPHLIILDDLDTSVSALYVFSESLQMVLHRMQESGRTILLTAQGLLCDTHGYVDLYGVENVNIPELSVEDIASLCVEFGCPTDNASIWSKSIWLSTYGHPKLVQVRIAELRNLGWSAPQLEDIVTQSNAVTSARQLSRRLLSNSQSEPIAEFLYMAAEISVPMDRSLALQLANSINGLRNAGDIVDSLIGRWLEQIENDLLRVTTLLKGAAAEVWPKNRIRTMHAKLHDVIRSKGTLDQLEAAALFFHAFMARDRKRLAITANQLQLLDSDDAATIVYQQLTWLPLIYLESGQSFTDDPFADASIRSLQFKVATLSNRDAIPNITERWEQAVSQIEHKECRIASEMILSMRVGNSECTELGLGPRLRAIASMLKLQKIQTMPKGLSHAFLGTTSIPEDVLASQFMILTLARFTKSIDSLYFLVNWLEQEATDEFRTEFELVLTWHLTQELGAFVHSAWAAHYENIGDWAPWLSVFDRIDEYARNFHSPNFGREVAKAKAIIFTEYLDNSNNALVVLSDAEDAFGPSAILSEQRANVLFHNHDDKCVLKVWDEILKMQDSKYYFDPFAYRRVAISAARLEKYNKATQTFIEGAESIDSESNQQTKFGLLIDASYTMLLEGRLTKATKILSDSVSSLPTYAKEDGNPHWEALQRVAIVICNEIEAHWKHNESVNTKLEIGYASSPALKVKEPQPRQRIRSELLVLNVITLAASLGVTSDTTLENEAKRLLESDIPLLRFLAAQAQLSIFMRDGVWDGFISTLVKLGNSVVEIESIGTERFLEPNCYMLEKVTTQPQKLLGLLTAALCCSSQSIIMTLEHWYNECISILGENSDLALILASGIDKMKDANYQPEDIIGLPTESVIVRCAAANQLLDAGQPPKLTAFYQGFIVSGIVRDNSYMFQNLFNHHIAVQFSHAWVKHTQARFNLINPQLTVPDLERVCTYVIDGRATLKELLITSNAAAAGVPTGEFLKRVW